ncbi:MAG TPA: DUF4388 domain-containing protein [Deltaproteobacteria bacterium]|nr:DUF4388 domain-containing protein [Deltaproteobacteria bacterium]
MKERKKEKILLALFEKEDIEGFSKFLKEREFDFVLATDGARAMDMAINEPPSLIIIDLKLPVINGERLFQILKNNPNTSRIPFLFISDTHQEIRGFRTGTDIFLTKPFQWEELYESVRQALAFGREKASIGDKDIQGNLSQMSLVDLLQVLHFNKKEGELVVTSPEGESGIIYIKDGQLYNAILGEIEKEKALFRLITWKDGTFEFMPKPVNIPQRLGSTTGNLIMEGVRQIDEFEKAKHLFPDKDSLLKTRVNTATLPKGLKPIIYEILFLVEYYPRVGDLVDHCSFPDYEVYTTLMSLINRRILVEVKRIKEEKEFSEEFVSPTLAIRIKEKVINRWADMLSVNSGKVFLVATSDALIKDFILACKNLPDFHINKALLSSDDGEPLLGDVGELRLYGGMDIVLFSVPPVRNMMPMLRAFSNNLIGLVLLWDEASEERVAHLMESRKEVLSTRSVPVLYVYGDKKPLKSATILKYRTLFNMAEDETVFPLHGKKTTIFKLFRTLFDSLTKEDYIQGSLTAT